MSGGSKNSIVNFFHTIFTQLKWKSTLIDWLYTEAGFILAVQSESGD